MAKIDRKTTAPSFRFHRGGAAPSKHDRQHPPWCRSGCDGGPSLRAIRHPPALS